MTFVFSPTGPNPATDKKNRPLVPVDFTPSGTHNSFEALEEVTRQEKKLDKKLRLQAAKNAKNTAAALADASSASGSGVGATTTGPSVSVSVSVSAARRRRRRGGRRHRPRRDAPADPRTTGAAVDGGRRWGGRLLLFLSALGAVAVGLPLGVALRHSHW
jgi:hypothetical protein